MTEALFYEKLDDAMVRCNLCRHRCTIVNGHRGICGVRENRSGVLMTLVYGKLIAEHIDPVEKKPLFHFQPGSRSYSVATVGCNFHCRHCQNYTISQVPSDCVNIPGNDRLPEEIVRNAVAAGCRSISYTYTEPTIFYELALETAKLAREAGLRNIFVTNGYITAEALEGLAPYLDAANIDLKGFTDSFYREIAGARLEGVLETIRECRRLGIWIELTTLLIPNLNDSHKELTAMAGFIADELGCDVPWHLSRFFPMYKMTGLPPTPVATLLEAAQIGRRAGLRHIYVGNVSEGEWEDTRCPGCDATLIRRSGYFISCNTLSAGSCPDCGTQVAGIWS
jgi:pyruvate formate lyase activating enzyme